MTRFQMLHEVIFDSYESYASIHFSFSYGWLVGYVLWHINPCMLFIAKFCLYVYIHVQPKISKRILMKVKFSKSRISFLCTRLTIFNKSYFLVQLCLSQEGQNVIYFNVEVVGTVQQVHCSKRRLLRRGLEFHVYTINDIAHTKKVWKLI